ncbi:MAG: UDP-N-acetylglucosamine 2-epimerase (non-hydrolyzing) [Planctomycetaceae bacterium]|nr:UDP-N-acetylglucosamine 2-epimerase (non-hydrolyzing) [Planctomycetaceae bacterium]
MKMMLVFGTRPEAIKMAPLVLAARRDKRVKPVVCVTGQHRQMLDQVNDYFGIRADIDLDLMTAGQSLSDLTARCLTSLTGAIQQYQPDCIVGQGDTTTAFCASMAAFYARIPFVHVEAGLRTDSIDSPFPEEFNRRVCSLTTALHCAPTEVARQNLLNEGYPAADVIVTGNTVLDALQIAVAQERLNAATWMQKHPDIAGRPMVLITAHRRENHGDGIRNLCTAIATLAMQFPKVQFVYPVHLNPNISGPVHERLADRSNVHLIAPADYPEFIWLMDQATLILSDSGGVQEEAPTLRKPVLVTRESTERPEALTVGATKLVGTNPQTIIDEVSRLLSDRDAYEQMQVDVNPYGDGKAAERIVELCVARFGSTTPLDAQVKIGLV